jgi:hypothetical protein
MASRYLFSKLVDAEMFILATRKVAAEAGFPVYDGATVTPALIRNDGICMALALLFSSGPLRRTPPG